MNKQSPPKKAVKAAAKKIAPAKKSAVKKVAKKRVATKKIPAKRAVPRFALPDIAGARDRSGAEMLVKAADVGDPGPMPGLVSFLYTVKFFVDYNRAFHQDPVGTARLFGFEPDAEDHINKRLADINKVPDDQRGPLFKKFLVDYLDYFVNEVVSTPPSWW